MEWKPTTLGVETDEVFCAHMNCSRFNEHMEFCTNDFISIKLFCNVHWELICEFFQDVRKCVFCERAHRADLYKEDRQFNTTKFQGKWWDLCARHGAIYDSMISPFLHLGVD